MKNLKWFGILAFVLFCTIALQSKAAYGPEEKRFGLGVYLGEPTGVTGKYYLAEKMAFQGIASWSFFDEAFTVIGDVLFDVHDLAAGNRDYALPIYIGAGAKFVAENNNAGNDSTFGVHVPIGIAWQSLNAPIEIAFEIAPGIDLAPETEFDINGGIAFRFYF